MTTDAPQRDAALSGKRRRWSMSVINFWIDATILLFLTALVVRHAYAPYAQRMARKKTPTSSQFARLRANKTRTESPFTSKTVIEGLCAARIVPVKTLLAKNDAVEPRTPTSDNEPYVLLTPHSGRST